ncbi:MAG: PEP/pyruvate-binding domain-containing protein [Anaerolineales bacterium]
MKTNTTDGYQLEYRPKYQTYRYLMGKRINEILLVSSTYDSFIIEEDARLSDQIFEEFHNLNLRTLPHIFRATSVDRALEMLQERNFDLVITMRRLGEINPLSFADQVKEIQDISVVLLLNNSSELQYLPAKALESSNIDHTFVWNGNSTVFVAIIKLLEDRLNVDQDIKTGDTRVIIVVEDSIRFYSLYLPVLYSEIMLQTHRLIAEGANDYLSLLQMRSRPKILLASSYEDALADYQKYQDHLLGLITDIRFPKDDQLKEEAGFDLVRKIRQKAPTLPIMLQSSNENNREQSEKLMGFFVNKNDRNLIHAMRTFLLDYMGFGCFTFRLPDDTVVGNADNLFELRDELKKVPLESFVYHASNDHFSGWLAARGEFAMARQVKPRKVSEFENQEDLRQLIINSVEDILQERMGIIVDFDRQNYHPHSRFIRLRPGSLGGKGRGLAFLLFLRSSHNTGFRKEFPDVDIQIPRTVVIGTDEFDQFMGENDLYDFVATDRSDTEIKERFLGARIPDNLRDDLIFLYQDISRPLAVRSSSIFEDSLFQPFAGVFSTYMLPNYHSDPDVRIDQIVSAIKLVYASTYLKLARSYAETLGISLSESRMAVVIQEVVGQPYGDRYYPNFSGTASSYNYYPLGDHLQPEDRIAFVVLGLGKTVVEGGLARRFSPKRPGVNIFASVEDELKGSQTNFYAVRLNHDDFIDLEQGESTFLNSFTLGDAIQDKTLSEIADTYDPQGGRLSSGYWDDQGGAPVITFNRQLKYDTFPLAPIINRILQLGEEAMGCPVEIEFAGNFSNRPGEKPIFRLLQLRPFLEHEETSLIEDLNVPEENLFVSSSVVSGNRVLTDIQDIIFVKPDTFDLTKTVDMVDEIMGLNKTMVKENQPYMLIGPGRWGTCERHLGIPVIWSDINGVRVIMEVDLENFQVDHSQGSHFFHNISSAGIPYFYIKYHSQTDFLDWSWLDTIPVVQETKYFQHVRTSTPLTVIANGKKRSGRVAKPVK